ncbi:hypothetical protein DTO164E3_1049 [Paecilomyces variotii]|nr:hypothetical protein DTO032I3_3713 [Paecilomyces variotii]KAJ9205796.1 hypothetical protein DTO164E3_1049 [Paecilomyces variotii]KAJ9275266.1 hypothetical protein DTO021D3_7912 [Paecilomyces variotii]KAJ9339685.1 hypothetical protein DTO027B6_7812 [Paecilomyces variotii]KAJ9375407.1 hypothetical protein DTO032I4_9114 [Paecilomyces variotii]
MSKFRRIGAGFCGTVWAEPDDSSAFKREDGGPGRSLTNDFEMHKRVIQSLEQLHALKKNNATIHETVTANAPPETSPTIITIPTCYRFITPADTDWWDTNLIKFPEGYTPCNVIHAQRIPPISQPVREFLIDTYCPPSITEEIKASDTNRDCLIRPYLGRRRVLPTESSQDGDNGGPSSRRPPRQRAFFSLRNFPLHIDQMEQLGISYSDLEVYTRGMADALATMHFNAGIDANDVEFVLAPPPPSHNTALSSLSERDEYPVISNVLGTHMMWILDFDCCRDIAVDEEKGLEQVITAFLRNDPFYPRPSSSEDLWRVFRVRYIWTVQEIVRDRTDADKERLVAFAERFVKGVEEKEMEKMQRRVSS